MYPDTYLAVHSSLKSLEGKKKWKFNPSFWLSQKFKSRAKRIDVMARIIFPMVFAIFNISYWTFYLLQSRNQKVVQLYLFLGFLSYNKDFNQQQLCCSAICSFLNTSRNSILTLFHYNLVLTTKYRQLTTILCSKKTEKQQSFL